MQRPHAQFTLSGIAWIKPAGIALVDGVVARKPVEVDAPPVPDGVARDEPPRPRVVVAVRQQGQAGFGVGVVAVLAAEAC